MEMGKNMPGSIPASNFGSIKKFSKMEHPQKRLINYNVFLEWPLEHRRRDKNSTVFQR
jgi:hypothetical protein